MGLLREPFWAKIGASFGPAPEALLSPFGPLYGEMHSEDWGAWPYAFRTPLRQGLKIGPKVGHLEAHLSQARARLWRGSGVHYGQIPV